MLAHQQQRDDHGDVAHRVDEEAHADARGGDEQPRDRGAEDARRVEQAGVQRDRVGQLRPAHHLDGEGLAHGCVDDEDRAARGGEQEHLPDLGAVGERETGEGRGDAHQRALGEDERPAPVEAVGERAAEEPEERVGTELADGERPDGVRRPVGELQDEPRLGDVLHPGAAQRHDLPAEVEAVVAVALQ